MPICETFTGSGEDICERFGSSTDKHGVGSGGAPGCWVGLDDRLEQGQRDLYGCGEGCGSCKDSPAEVSAQHIVEGGTRWLRPKGRSRDARGMLHDLRSGEPWPINLNVTYEKGACYRQDGIECFGMSPCSCFPGPVRQAGQGLNACPDGTPLGAAIVSDFFPDHFTTVGLSWRNEQHNCRSFREVGSLNVRTAIMLGGKVPLPTFIRSDDTEGSGCMANALVQCLGKPKDSAPCPGFYLNDPLAWPDPTHRPSFWQENLPVRNLFNRANIVRNTVDLNIGGAFPFGDSPVLAIKRAAIRRIFDGSFTDTTPGGPQRFDHVDRNFVEFDETAKWDKTFNGFRDCTWSIGVPETLIDTFPHCRLAEARVDVTARCWLLFAKLSLYLFAMKYVDTVPESPTPRQLIEWHARFQLEGELAWTVDGGGVTNDAADCFNLPSPPAGDRILYIDNGGRRFRPPRQVTWLGYLGRLGVGDAPRRPGGGDPIQVGCSGIADSLRGATVAGWPVLADSWPSTPDKLYTGALDFEFERP